MNPQNQPNNPQTVFTPDQPPDQDGQINTEEEKYKSRSLSSQPYAVPQPEQPDQKLGAINDPEDDKGFKLSKGPVIAGIVGLTVVVALILVAVLAGGGNSGQNEQSTAPEDAGQAQALQPATSIELEQASNALSQDLSSLDDEKDLPNNSLDDQTLGL